MLAVQSQAFLGFGSSKDKPPKLHVLMRTANDYIEEAQVCELNGDGDKAIEFYKKALDELDKIVAEKPERAETAEFAPLRNKAAVCNIQIDAIKLEQINANERRVAVTDTTALQKKYDEKHGIRRLGGDKGKTTAAAKEKASKEAEAEAKKKVDEKQAEAADEAKKTVDEKKADAAAEAKRKADEVQAKSKAAQEAARRKAAELAAEKEAAKAAVRKKTEDGSVAVQGANATESLQGHIEDAKDAISLGKYDDATKALVAALKIDPENWDARYLMAYVNVVKEDYDAADVLFADILADRPDNVSALLLHAAAQMARGAYAAAQTSVTSAIRANPSYYAGYYDMATLLVEMGSSKETARKYYEAGRERGGPKDAELEKLLK